jgi:hypothetical protein|tara:strand:- start:3433 stop:3981 length:549 start_codon:yes stop_codon:yes gene_type:complete
MYRKLNEEWQINHLIKTGKKIEYGIDTPIGFAGIRYSYVQTKQENELLQVIPSRYRDKCTLSLMEVNHKIPAHTDSGIEAIINFYIRTDRMRTQFYHPREDVETVQIANQTDGAIFHDKYLKKSDRFMAHPGEAYLLNVSHPHALIPSQKGPIKRLAICMQLLDTSWDEAVDMLKETGYIDD